MRHKVAVAVALIMLVSSLGACRDSATTKPDTPASPQQIVEQAVRAELGSRVATVTLSGRDGDRHASWTAIINLDSTPDTATLDAAAAGILAEMASFAATETPLYLTVLGAGLRPEWTDAEWGYLSYGWANPNSIDGTPRPDTVYLIHGEADPPDWPDVGHAYIARPRGEWPDVSEALLATWAREGTPTLQTR